MNPGPKWQDFEVHPSLLTAPQARAINKVARRANSLRAKKLAPFQLNKHLYKDVESWKKCTDIRRRRVGIRDFGGRWVP
jgi:hypothetical protein